MDKPRIYPADPVEAAQAPVAGVDVPATDTAVHSEGDQTAVDRDPAKQRAFAENEGLVKPASRNASSIEGGRGDDLQDQTHAAQRGRIA